MSQKRYVVVGDGAAGITAAQRLRQADAMARIIVVSDDPNPAYYRAALTNYLLGELNEHQIWAVPADFFGTWRIERQLARVAQIDPQRSQLWLTSGGRALEYDALLIATGASARPPPFEGAQIEGVATLRTLQDARWVMDQLQLAGVSRAVVVGGGPLALEWSQALRERGAAVTLCVRERGIMQPALDAAGSDLVLARARRSGIDVRLATEIDAALPGPQGRVAGVRTKSGEVIGCELVGVAIGVAANSAIAAAAGVALGPTGAIVVDERMKTSLPNVYAAGDVCEHQGRVTQLWEPARMQGAVAAANMAGGDKRFRPGALYFATRLWDLDFASIGRTSGEREIVEAPRETGRLRYRKLVLERGRLVGALLLAERSERIRQRGRLLKRLVDEAVDVSPVADRLMDEAFDLGGWLDVAKLVGSRRLPDAAAASAAATAATVAAAAHAQPSPAASGASLRGTQFLQLGGIAETIGEAPRGGTVLAAAPAGTGDGTVLTQSPEHAGTALAGTAHAGTAYASTAYASTAYAGTALAPPAGSERRKMLSIGLPIAPLEPPPPSTGGAAFLEDQVGRRLAIELQSMTIGRDPSCQLVLGDPYVSGRHAEVTRADTGLYVRDLGSRGGTWVNERPVTVPHALRDGDRITIGRTTLAFRSEGAPASRIATSQPVSSAQQSQPMSRLVVRAGHALGVEFAVTGQSVTIGRDPACNIRLDDMSVSRRHAVLNLHGNRWHVCDLHSSRGTFKGADRLKPAADVPIENGEELRLGDVVLLFQSR
jgi:NADPH-dependent 2,4-dienoyl-CoA reductase/sulfur reductase-like enzyme/pSer/pThr/pTyr-binding forkhead associated (FHA) protein